MITPHRTPHRLLSLCLACVLTATAPFATAQTLARPGWVGSGLTTDTWWKRAVIYQINPIDFSPAGDSPLHGVVRRLDYIHSLGTDAILLTHLQPDATQAQTIDPALGTLDDFDDLLREASSRHLHVLLDLDPAIPAADLPSVARFWLNRGIAGFHLSGSGDVSRAQAATLHATTASYLGQRILIADAVSEAAPSLTAVSQPVAVAPPEAQAPVPPQAVVPPPTEPRPTDRFRHHAHGRSRRHSRTHSSATPSNTQAKTTTDATASATSVTAKTRTPSARTQGHTALDAQSPQLLLNDRIGSIATLNAGAIRPVLENLQAIQESGHSVPLLATDGPGFVRSMSRYSDGQHDLAIAKLLATLLFTTRAESLLYYGQELGVRTPSSADAAAPLILWNTPPPPKPAPVSEAYVPYKPSNASSGDESYVPYKPPSASPTAAPAATPVIASASTSGAVPNAAVEDADPDSLLNWYRQLSSIHHGNATLATGTSMTLNRDDQNVLVLIRKPKIVTASSPVMVLLFNLSGQPVQLSLKADTTRLGLRGSFLRTVLRSYDGIGTMHLEEMTLPAYGAYIGELRY